jgi:hypothetical protein
VGFDCLGKYCANLYDMAVVLCKQHTYKKNSKNANKRLCFGCKKNNINNTEEEWRTICKSCWISGIRDPEPLPILGYKMCEVCFILCIGPSEPDYKTTCSRCYKQAKIEEKNVEKRECNSCHQLSIPVTEPTFKTMCHACFLLAKENEKTIEKRECQICHKLAIPISEPSFKTFCNTCYSNNKKEENGENKNGDKRECSNCHKLAIPLTDPDFKTLCAACYKMSLTNYTRECEMCHLVTIKESDPSYVTKCHPCYLATKNDKKEEKEENKEENKEEKPKKRECISCHKKNIDGSKPKLITKCAKCYTKNEDTIPDLTMHMGNLNLLSTIVNKKI